MRPQDTPTVQDDDVEAQRQPLPNPPRVAAAGAGAGARNAAQQGTQPTPNPPVPAAAGVGAQNADQQSTRPTPSPPVAAGGGDAAQNLNQESAQPATDVPVAAGAGAQNGGDLTRPLLNAPAGAGAVCRRAQRPLFRGTATLANQLPTGTVLVFRMLSPIFTNLGECDVVFQVCTWALMAVCGASCVILSFTDSFIDDDGTVRYVFATLHGMWVIDGSPEPPPGVAARYSIRLADLAHTLMTLAIFVAIAVLDEQLVICLYPTASSYEILALKLIPLLVAVICSILFIRFPTARHGIGFPVAVQ